MSAVASQAGHLCGQETSWQQETLAGNERTDRDSKGRFVKGNAGGPGNPFNRQVAALRQQLVHALTPERMGKIIEAVAQKAERGDLAAAKLLWQYGMGKPAQPVEPDRMDVEELALYQEQQLSPEAWLRIIKSIPAEMACRMLRPLMPVLNQSAAKGIQQLAPESGIEVRQPAPSATEDNGEEAPMANGGIGEREPSAKGGNGEAGGVASGASTASQSACPRQRGHGTATATGGHRQVERADYAERPSPNGENGSQQRASSAISLVPARPTAGAKRKPSRAERRAEALRLRRLKAKWGLP